MPPFARCDRAEQAIHYLNPISHLDGRVERDEPEHWVVVVVTA